MTLYIVDNHAVLFLQCESSYAFEGHVNRRSSWDTDHNNRVSLRCDFSCEYSEQMKTRMTLYIAYNHRVLFLQCELSYDVEGHMNRRSSWDTDHNNRVSLRCDCSCEPLNYGTL
jgi:hypothetical protein